MQGTILVVRSLQSNLHPRAYCQLHIRGDVSLVKRKVVELDEARHDFTKAPAAVHKHLEGITSNQSEHNKTLR